MKTYKKYIDINTENKIEFINITEQIRTAVKESGVEEGIVLISSMHITASVFVNDNESGLLEDFKVWLEKLAPKNEKLYKHNLTGGDNAYAHLWRTIMGRETTIAVSDFDLDLGPWEAIFYGEFEGQRTKRISIKIIGE